MMKKLYTKFILLGLLSFLWTGLSFGQILIDEELRSGSLPTGWSQADISFETGAGGYARFDETNSILTTPTFDASANASIDVNFAVAKWGSGDDGPITVEYSLDEGATWVTAGDSTIPDGSSYLDNTIPISTTSATMQVRFTRASSPSRKRFRDVVIEGVGSGGGGSCSITDIGLANINCNDNGTPSDSLDDITSFELNPTGTDLGATYTVDMDGFANISTNISGPFTTDTATATYGSATTFYLEPGSAGIGGDLDALVIDDNDVNCFEIATITDPGTCSSGGGTTACGVEINFETQGVGYSTSITEFTNVDADDYFTQTNGSNINGTFTGADGSFFAAQDIDGEGATLPVELTINNIDISTLTNLEFSIDLAEDDDGSNEDWDQPDYVRIFYSIDGGTEENLLWIHNDGSTFNSAPFIDTDFDGVGDGAEITDTFTTFTESIAGTGTTMDIRIEFSLDSADEDIAIDNISVCGLQSSSTYTYTDDTTGWNINPVTGTPPSTIADNIEVLAGTAVLDGVIEGKNLSVSSGATLELGINAVLSLDGDITNDGTILFKSDLNGSVPSSAQLDTFTGTISGSGEVSVERYIPSKRAFRLLSSAVSGVSIADSWQQDTHITGAVGTVGQTSPEGFDETSSGESSMFTFNNSGQDWSPIANTNATNLQVGEMYRLMVRGSRSTVDLTSNTSDSSPVTLTATGSLETGTLTTGMELPAMATGNNQVSALANPYQAVIDVSALGFNGDVKTDYIAVWDAFIGGINGRGAYVEVDINANSPSPSSSDANKYIMPGQSFFIRNLSTVSTAPSIEFTEAAKATTQSQNQVFSAEAYLNLRLYTQEAWNTNSYENDALGIRWSANYTTPVSDEDALKFSNPEENFAVLNQNTLVGIDKRNLPDTEEVIPLYINNLNQENYVIYNQFANLSEDGKLFLEDHYLETSTLLNSNEVYSFSIDPSIEASFSSDRFSIRFNPETLSNADFTADRFSIYPNPVQNQFNIAISSELANDAVQVEVFDVMGRSMLKEEVLFSDQKVQPIEAASLPSGVYLVQINAEGKTFTQRIIKM